MTEKAGAAPWGQLLVTVAQQGEAVLSRPSCLQAFLSRSLPGASAGRTEEGIDNKNSKQTTSAESFRKPASTGIISNLSFIIFC